MRILDVSERNFKNAIKESVEIIKQGGVLVLPTDTVYGLLADATNKKAVERIFKIKERSKTKPLPIFVKDIKAAKKFAHINKEQEKILGNKWPGKFTFVLKRKKAKIFGVDEKTIALRIPDYEFVNILLEKIKRPLVGTSANISGQPASTKIKEVLAQFENKKTKPDLVVDAGDLPEISPSTIIDLTGEAPQILRH